MIVDGLFREDLLFRINTITIELPPLRERGNDVQLLADFFLNKYAYKYNKKGLIISNQASKKLTKYSWPGNVRELQHSIEKAVILADDSLLDHDSFSLDNNALNSRGKTQFQTIEEMEREMILASISKEKGNMSIVAKKLGITRQTLYNKLKKYDQ
jgi:DNA-binding NtrC family response regulator